jgi:hypothetical protein
MENPSFLIREIRAAMPKSFVFFNNISKPPSSRAEAQSPQRRKGKKMGGKNIKTGDFFDPIFLPAIFFLGSPGKGRGMRGRMISRQFEQPLMNRSPLHFC